MSRERIDDKIDEAVLALLYLGIFEREPMMGARTWKSFDWDAMERLHQRGPDFRSGEQGQIGDVDRYGVAPG